MKITLISQEEHQTLLDVYNNYSALTLQNKGYEGINRSKFTDIEKEKDAEVNEILRKSICGFSVFQNFKTNNPKKELRLRFQYNWSADWDPLKDKGAQPLSFTGVGYIGLHELLNGFDK